MKETLGERVKRFRAEEKLSKKDLADILGVSVAYVRYIESGAFASPSMKFLSKISDLFTDNINELIDMAIYNHEKSYRHASSIDQEKALIKINERYGRHGR